MTRTRWRGLGAGAALLALMAQPLSAAAHEGEHHEEEHDDPVEVVEPLRARTADAALIARATDLETGQVLDLLEEQNRFGDLLVQLADAYPDTYTSGVAPDEPGAPGLVRFAGEVPEKARALAERAEVAVEFEGDAPASARELQARSQRVHDALLEQGVKRVATAVLPDGVILATIPDREEVDLPRGLREGVRVQTTDGLVAVDEHTRGGAWVRDDGVRECTSGFAVESTGGTRGVTTAGHCTGIDEYEQPSDGLVYSLTHQLQHVGTWGDVEWKTSPHWEPAEYYATATQVRDVTSIEPWWGIAVNDWVCVYGRSSNSRSCDQVYATFVTVTTAAGTASCLIAMDDDSTIGGDSGGPWSFGTEAFGTHKGDASFGGSTRNVWSVADLFPSALGVTVRTQ